MIALESVDFPEPFGPMIACTWFVSTARSTPLTISVPSSSATCRFFSSSNAIPGPMVAATARGAGRQDEAVGWVALLRGINVGGKNRVPMAELRRVLEEDGLDEVRTFIASGNVLFTGGGSNRAALGRRLEKLVDETFGVPAAVVLRTFAELRAV